MGKQRTYNLKHERHLEPQPDGGKHYPTEVRRLVRRYEQAKVEKNALEACNVAAELVELNEEVGDWAKVIRYASDELKWSTKLKGRELSMVQKRAHMNLAKGYRGIADWDLSFAHFKLYKKIAEELKDAMELCQAYFELGLTFLERGESEDQHPLDYAEAFQGFKHAKEVLEKAEKERRIYQIGPEEIIATKIQIFINIGITCNKLNKFEKASQALNVALSLAREMDDGSKEKFGQMIFRELSTLHQRTKNYDEAIACAKREIHFATKTNDLAEKGRAIENLAILYRLNHEYEKALDEYKKILVHCREIGDEEFLNATEEEIRETNNLIATEKRLAELNDRIARAERGGKRFQNDLIVALEERGDAFVTTARFSAAIADFERRIELAGGLDKMALTTRLPLIFKLAYAYADHEKHEEAITLFQKFLFLLPKRDTIKDRIDVLLKLGELMQTVSRSHQELVTIYEELLEIGITSRDLDLQWEALCQLEWVHEKYNYNDKARICKEKKLEVERLKALESDKSVIDPEMNDDDDSGNNPEEPTLDLVDTDFDGFTTPPPRNQQESPASSTSKRKNDNANTGGSSSKKSKYQIQTLDLESDASEPSTPTKPTKQKSVVELLDSDSDLDDFFNNTPKSPAKNSKSNQKQKSRNTAVISSSPVTSQSLGKPPASSSAKNHTIFSSPTRSPVRTPRKPRNAIFGQEDTEIEIPDSTATPPPSTPPFRPVEIPQTPQSKNSSMMLNITLRDGETESEIQIPYSAGPTGTPKTVRWLMEETDKRYKNLTKTSGTFISRLLSANTQTGATRELRKTDCIPNAMKDQEIIIAQIEKSI